MSYESDMCNACPDHDTCKVAKGHCTMREKFRKAEDRIKSLLRIAEGYERASAAGKKNRWLPPPEEEGGD